MLCIPDQYVGHAAGLATSCLWTATALCFTAAGRRIGAMAVNATRVTMAVILLGLTHHALTHRWIPVAEPRQFLFLGLSGVLGLAIGDQALFMAFVEVGPRLSELIMMTAPVFAALLGWLVLGEMPGGFAWLGITLTIAGVCWVILERTPAPDGFASHNRGRGMILAFIGALCQAGGLLLSKQGLGHGWLPPERHMLPQAATLVRMFFASLAVVPIFLIRWHRGRARYPAGAAQRSTGQRRTGLLLALAGSFVGPYLGVWMSMEATDRAPLGVAQTLLSLPPILILPFTHLVFKERVSVRAVLGAVVALAGIALLFLPAALQSA